MQLPPGKGTVPFLGFLLFSLRRCLSDLLPVFPLKAKPEFFLNWKKRDQMVWNYGDEKQSQTSLNLKF